MVGFSTKLGNVQRGGRLFYFVDDRANATFGGGGRMGDDMTPCMRARGLGVGRERVPGYIL